MTGTPKQGVALSYLSTLIHQEFVLEAQMEDSSGVRFEAGTKHQAYDHSNKCKHCGHVAALRRTMPPHYPVTQEGESGFELQVGFTVSTGA